MARLSGWLGGCADASSAEVEARAGDSKSRHQAELGLGGIVSTRWDRLAGDTSRFAIRIAFAPDPDDGRGIDSETGLSWGSFQLWVDGRNLCSHFEQGERIDSVHWYLLPLIEWFVGNWNPLLHEERLPVKNEAPTAWTSLRGTMFAPAIVEMHQSQAYRWERTWQGWWQRHALRAASDGGLFPDVVFRRCRDTVEISWGRARSVGMPDQFDFAESGPGAVRLAPSEVAEPLHAILSGALEYLCMLDGESERLTSLGRALRALSRNNQRQRRLMWLAGLGVDEKTMREGWRRVKRWLADLPEADAALMHDSARAPLVVDGSCHATLMFGCVAPDIRKDDAVRLAEAMVRLHSNGNVSKVLRCRRRFLPVDELDTPPWYQGYEMADEFHEEFEGLFTAGDEVDIDRILQELEIGVEELSLSDETIRGVAIAGLEHAPCIGWNPNSVFNLQPWGRRFTLAHELCHLLFDWETGRALAIASGPWAPLGVERRANSFAAMLLMPTSLVQKVVSNLDYPLETYEGVAAVAKRLGTGFQATLWHLRNLGLIGDHVRDCLLEAVAGQQTPDATTAA